ncbi:MAG: autotransporter-associated beta strand repeat-containing protein [Planctomycetia bacterium]|nr:autotransporter-associated beta strand repeat-containing protein [Planctomycetia bacterium]
MKYLRWTGNVALLLGWLVSVGEAAPTWSPALSGNALQGNTTVTLDGNYTQSSALTGNYSLTVTGGYTLEFTEAQKFTGGTVIGAGTTVKLNRPNTSGMAEGILPNSIQINGGTLEIAAGGQMGYEKTATITTVGGVIKNTSTTHAILKDVYLSNGSTIEVTAYERTGWGGDFALDGNLYATAGESTLKSGKYVLSARYSGSANTVTMDVSSGATLSVKGEMYDLEQDAGATLAGSRTLRKTGEGTLKLLQNQYYTGGTIVEKGTLELAAGSSAAVVDGSYKPGLVLGTITVEKDGILKMSSTAVMGYGNLSPVLNIRGGTVDNTSGGHNLLYKVTLSDGGVIQSDATGTTGWGGNYALDGDITVTSGDNLIQGERLVMASRFTSTQYTNLFDVRGVDTVLTLDGNLLQPTAVIDTTSARNLKKTGSGTLVLKGEENTYSGVTEVVEGTLRIDSQGTETNRVSLLSDVKITGGELRLVVDGGVSDNLAIAGRLDLAEVDSLVIDLGENLPVVGEIYPILTATEGIWLGGTEILSTADFAQFLSSEARHYMNVLSIDGGFGLATDSAAVPEPSTWILGILGLGFLWLQRRSGR